MIKHHLKDLNLAICTKLQFLVFGNKFRLYSVVLLENLFYNVLGKIHKIWWIYYQRVNLQDNGNWVNHWNHCETKQAKDGWGHCWEVTNKHFELILTQMILF